MKIKNNIKIQIPDEIIRNKYFVIDSNTFAMYTYFKYLHFRQYNNAMIEVDITDLKNTLHITDNRTLKKCFMSLYNQDIILECITKMPTRKPITITFAPELIKSDTFTQLPATILDKIDMIGTTGLRLLFYYESFINRKSKLERQFAFPAIETTAATLNINKETVVNYNKILHDNGLLLIIKYEIKWNGEYTEDKQHFTKYNNHYIVQLKNI